MQDDLVRELSLKYASIYSSTESVVYASDIHSQANCAFEGRVLRKNHNKRPATALRFPVCEINIFIAVYVFSIKLVQI